ncbi:VanZ family protein [Aeribacillus pallidus]|uniref:VanZ family protein n=1 Tax=Aeribacillus pallidus TaxID=33936 RepID=UPI003D24A36E
MKHFIRLLFTVAPFIYMGLIWYLSSHPDDKVIALENEWLDRWFKESLHLVEFGLLYLMFIAALLVNRRLTVTAHILAAIVASFYGFIDEIHQAFVPYRSASIIDAAKDLTGVAFSFWFVSRFYFKNPRSWFGKKMQSFASWMEENKERVT